MSITSYPTSASGPAGRSRRSLMLLLTTLALCAAALLLLLPPAREGAKALCNALFDASERVNRYQYDRISVAGNASPSLAGLLLTMICAVLTTLAYLTPGAALPLLLAVALAVIQSYFGLSLPAAVNIFCFGVLALAIVVKHGGFRAALPFAAFALAAVLTVSVLFPGVHAPVEDASERVRDLLGAAFEQEAAVGGDQTPEVLETRHENRRDLLSGTEEAISGQTYRLLTVEEEPIALPHWIDYLRIALLCLLIPAVLAAPFVPFVWLNRQTRRTADRLARLDSADCTEVLLGAFDLVIGYLDACGVGDANALYLHRVDAASPALPEDYTTLFHTCANAWQAVVYGGQTADDALREQALRLLDQTEAIFYTPADLRTRLRLRYLCCLHE